jgi:Nitrous oxide-stimulated promoter
MVSLVMQDQTQLRQKRFRRERKTINAMIAIFCRDQHAPAEGLCPECSALSAYAEQRLDNCPFGDDKPTCAKCPIHCYKPAAREEIRTVMRYAGPRMLFRRPVLAIFHLLEGRKEPPAPPRRKPAPDS